MLNSTRAISAKYRSLGQSTVKMRHLASATKISQYFCFAWATLKHVTAHSRDDAFFDVLLFMASLSAFSLFDLSFVLFISDWPFFEWFLLFRRFSDGNLDLTDYLCTRFVFCFWHFFFSIKLGKIRFSTIFALLFDSSSSSKVSLYSIFDYLIQYKNSLILQNIWLFSPILQWPTHTQKGWIEKILQYSTMLPRSALMPSRRRICGACGAIYTTTTRRVRGSRATIWPLLGMLLATKLMMRTFFLGSPIFCTIDVLCEKERKTRPSPIGLSRHVSSPDLTDSRLHHEAILS